MEIKTNVEYNFGELVYLKTDEDQKERMVIGIVLCIDGGILYDLVCGTNTTKHYPHEISRDKKY